MMRRRERSARPAPPDGAQPRVPWVHAIAERWSELIGDHAERDRIVDVVGRALMPSTAENYGRHFGRFVDWCERQPDKPSPLPASTGTVLRWLAADVTAGGAVAAQSLQGYLSALNSIHADLDFELPALGHLVRRFRAGLAHEQADRGRDAMRVYLPPPVVSRLLDWALALDLRRKPPRVQFAFRAAVATVFTFVFFARGATGAKLRVKDVRRSVAGLTVTLDHEKGKRQLKWGRTITIPPGSVPGLEELLDKWEAFRGDDLKPDEGYYALPWAERKRAFSTSAINDWLAEALAQLDDVAPPEGDAWTGHSLRKGAASGSAAEGVPLDRTCWMGGWSVQSRVVFDYIDPTCPQTAASRRFFGWLRPA